MATTNTVNAALKRDVILNDMMRAFKLRILPVLNFAKVIRDVPLQGTDKINVPYFPLHTTASVDFSSAYAFADTTNTSYKQVQITKRKYQPLSWTSSERSRQPALDTETLLMLKAEKLGDDVITDIFSVITAATYGTASVNIAAASWNADQAIALKKVADDAYWPKTGRSLLVNTDIDTYLMRDPLLGGANYLSAEAIREGRVPRIAGFDYVPVPNVPTNSENLAGFIAWPSAIMVAFAPIQPTAEVMSQLTEYRTVTDPETGLTLEYRRWGNPDADESREVIECNYGYAAGETAALKRITVP